MIALALALTLAFAPAQRPTPSNVPDQGPAPAAAASPQDSALSAEARDLATSLRCPVCTGQSLQDSDAPLAGEMRDLIRDKLRSGESPQQVRAYFVSKYGQWILLQPEARGFNLTVYVLPVLGLLAGGALILLAARRWVRAGQAEAEAEAEAEEPTASEPSGRS